MTIGGKTKTVGRDITVAEVLEQVKKDRPYYARSGGGMTLSGGESLMQYRFAADLLRGAKEAGINTALESTACADYEKIRALLENLDTYLLDIKHIDSRKHKEFTGVGNELILANALKLSEDAKKLVIRVPVIPGFNNTEAEILEIAKFAADLKNVTHIHLLPYHRLGYDKYIGLGREYTMGDAPLNTAEHIARLKRVAESTGLICEIGG